MTDVTPEQLEELGRLLPLAALDQIRELLDGLRAEITTLQEQNAALRSGVVLAVKNGQRCRYAITPDKCRCHMCVLGRLLEATA